MSIPIVNDLLQAMEVLDIKDQLLDRIRRNAARFTPAERRIATQITENPQEVAFLPAVKLAKLAETSEATVVRFAKTLEYESFPAMQGAAREGVRRQLALSSTERFKKAFLIDPDDKDLVNEIMSLEFRNLDKTLHSLEMPAVERIVDSLVGAETVYVLGQRGSAPLAQHMSYTLEILLPRVVGIVYHSDTVLEPLMKIRATDTLLVFGFARPSQRTLMGIELAKERKAKVCAITDNVMSPIARLADEVLVAASESLSFIQSYTAGMAVCNVLHTALGRRIPREAELRLSEWEEVLQKFEILYRS